MEGEVLKVMKVANVKVVAKHLKKTEQAAHSKINKTVIVIGPLLKGKYLFENGSQVYINSFCKEFLFINYVCLPLITESIFFKRSMSCYNLFVFISFR